MAYFEAGTLLIKGDVRRAYNLQAAPTQVYEYLSDMRNLLSQVPNTRKLQIGKNSGRARMFITVEALGVGVDGVIDVEPSYDPSNYTIRLKTPEQALGPVPPRHLSGQFQGFIRATSNENGTTQVVSRIILAFDAGQVELLSLFPRAVIEYNGPVLLQQYAETLCDEYVTNLLRSFRKWQAQKKG